MWLGLLLAVVGLDGRTEAMPDLQASATYRVQAWIEGPVGEGDRSRVTLELPGGDRVTKTLHGGDPSLTLSIRPRASGEGRLIVEPASEQIRVSWARRDVPAGDVAAIEAEPNDSWDHANPLTLGRNVYGSADDVDYLDNLDEGKTGIDWFRFEVPEDERVLAYFFLELFDRDVSANLRVHVLDPVSQKIRLYDEGKDPTEVIHDRERERYSTHLSRTLGPGTYFVEVNANHPDYVLRTRTSPVPPFSDPARAVEVGLDYLLEAGDAWFAQIPREGHIYQRSGNLHDTATRCTACHVSSFPVEAALVGQANGYPIRARSSLLYLTDRLANSPTPLYGDAGLYWQRFIAVPLQSQGKQGSILFDFERQVLGRETSLPERFGPFLRAAWAGRYTMPPDESNGVVPLDSKFGAAWRDWLVLTEMTRRTRRVAYAQAADAIADLLDDPATDAHVETLQDRIHRLHAWNLINKEHFQTRIRAEAEALLALQNPDGGWHELDRKPGPSAVYTTGQMTWTLLRAGYSREDPRIQRALAYLLERQQPFGGWFQTSTHENFRTPMRETRYAIEALAEAYPRPRAPLTSWGNRDGRRPRIPRGAPLSATLEDLDNLWDVTNEDRPAITLSLLDILKNPDFLARARAAEALGRVGDASAVASLVRLLADPAKPVSRAAAWSLRRLGNQGLGLDAIAGALGAADPAVRRGATRIFAYQFMGMDGRIDLADCLVGLTNDGDLLTRLQALRSLRQWFYRTSDNGLRRRIVDAYLARMGVERAPVVRKALTEGMYILLDENLGGGVSLQKNLAALPEKYRGPALRGREAVERDVLLGPLFAALETGNPLQREGILASFDGSLLKGRSFARRPTGMLDVGNDREFGFLYEPPTDLLDRTFAAVFAAESTPEARARAIRLSRFFQVPSRSTRPAFQVALLQGMTDPDPRVRDAARAAVAEDLELTGAEDDPARVALIVGAFGGDSQACRAVATALARSSRLMARPEIAAAVRDRLRKPDGPTALAPLLGRPILEDAEVIIALKQAWTTTPDPRGRAGLVNSLFERSGLVGTELRAEAKWLIEAASRDASSLVRERLLTELGNSGHFLTKDVIDPIIVSALADDSPPNRRLALGLGAAREAFWERPEARERLLACLIDPDAKTRDRALGVVERQGLAARSVAIARRVKAASGDPALAARAQHVLINQGFDPNSVTPDASLGRRRLPGLAGFRDRVEPWFAAPGEDGVSCVRCHAAHDVFRVDRPGPETLAMNYASALRVANLVNPEASLLIRKPRSPQGQGASDPASPTGLTHAGGPRWDSDDHPAVRAILAWLRDTVEPSPAQASSDGHAPGHEPALATDGDPATAWRTEFVGANPAYPHELVLDLGSVRLIDALIYVPRQDASVGRVKDYQVDLSSDGQTWTTAVARGAWPDDAATRVVPLPGTRARHVRLRGLSEQSGRPDMAVAEVAVESRPVPSFNERSPEHP
jgi:HEAT repeat protein